MSNDDEQCPTCSTSLPSVPGFLKPSNDSVDHPIHYGGAGNPYEVIKVLEHWLTREEFIGALKFNIIKYQARANAKNGDEDLRKAAWYAQYLADYLKKRAI